VKTRASSVETRATNENEEAGDVDGVRARILSAAAALIASGGREAATTRAVASAAAVQAPTIYRIFGDKDGLLAAVAEDVLAAYVAAKVARKPHPDPIQELRSGWDLHVAFGLGHPDLFAILTRDAQVDGAAPSPSLLAGHAVLRRRIQQIAAAGRLQTTEARALGLVQAACVGTVLTLLREPPERRDPGLSGASREAVLAAICTEHAVVRTAGPSAAAATLRAQLDQTSCLTEGERLLLGELLDRIARGDPAPGDAS
jgi:AcrR family transcriptional regulator